MNGRYPDFTDRTRERLHQDCLSGCTWAFMRVETLTSHYSCRLHRALLKCRGKFVSCKLLEREWQCEQQPLRSAFGPQHPSALPRAEASEALFTLCSIAWSELAFNSICLSPQVSLYIVILGPNCLLIEDYTYLITSSRCLHDNIKAQKKSADFFTDFEEKSG